MEDSTIIGEPRPIAITSISLYDNLANQREGPHPLGERRQWSFCQCYAYTWTHSTMPQQLKIRAACDRCHSQKLRCLKRPGINGCLRCYKAGTGCAFSPSLRSLRSKEPNGLMDPQTEMRAGYSSDNHLNGDMDLDDRTGADDPICANEDPRSHGKVTCSNHIASCVMDGLLTAQETLPYLPTLQIQILITSALIGLWTRF